MHLKTELVNANISDHFWNVIPKRLSAVAVDSFSDFPSDVCNALIKAKDSVAFLTLGTLPRPQFRSAQNNFSASARISRISLVELAENGDAPPEIPMGMVIADRLSDKV